MRKKYLIITLIISLTLIIGGTFAWLSWQSEENTNFTLNIGEVAEVFFTGGNEVKASGIGPVISEEEGEITEFQILKKIEDSIILQVSFNPTILPAGLKEESFKYKLYSKTNEKDDYTLACEGNFKDKIQGIEFSLIDELEVTSNTSYYRFIIYIDGNMLNPSTMKGQDFEGTILITSKSNGTPLATFISDKYNNASKSPVVNNNITYNYAPSESLMADTTGNIRYYGASPNNYLYFNCTDYNNQTADTCELWRIIGVFGDKLKIIRPSIGKLAWDQDRNDNSKLTSYDNNWSTSTLQKLLNDKYYMGTEKVTYYSDSTGNTIANLNFANIGLKNDETRSKIAEVTWNLGGWDTSGIYSDQIYDYERGTTVYSGRPTVWTGKIALMYMSDYGYATDFTRCTSALLSYGDSTNSYACRTNDWLFNNAYQWLLNPRSKYGSDAFLVESTGYIGTALYGTSTPYIIRPTLFLTSDQVISSETTGSSSDPYRLAP